MQENKIHGSILIYTELGLLKYATKAKKNRQIIPFIVDDYKYPYEMD